MIDAPLALSAEVAEARTAGKPIVALESTIITHGMPWPQNHETALAVEAAVREAGAVPATIAVMNGRIHIGLGADDPETLARSTGVMKLSRADLAVRLRKTHGATTVAATMICAHSAGIEVFATGGIGGVHRGAGTFVRHLGRSARSGATPVTVVAAGRRRSWTCPTLEDLETSGVPVIAFGQDDSPAFWSRSWGSRRRCGWTTRTISAAAARTHAGAAG
ncbi:MAG: pseudouridine-5'-phosphate glycosidase [Paracoccaceae bacterium]